MPGGGFPWEPLLAELRAAGVGFPRAPSEQVSDMAVFRALWSEAGLEAIESREIEVQRSFAGFDDFWRVATSTGPGKAVAAMPPQDVEALKGRLRERVAPDDSGHITCRARANAVVGRVA
jgi:hypothetical protein